MNTKIMTKLFVEPHRIVDHDLYDQIPIFTRSQYRY